MIKIIYGKKKRKNGFRWNILFAIHMINLQGSSSCGRQVKNVRQSLGRETWTSGGQTMEKNGAVTQTHIFQHS